MKKIWILAAIAILSLVIATVFFLGRLSHPKVYLTSTGDIRYSGKISARGFDQLKALHDEAVTKPQKVVITSTGGSMAVGLVMGQWVFEHQLVVHVKRHCLSACANYLFPAAREKILTEDAVILWHGGAFQENLREQVDRGKALSDKATEARVIYKNDNQGYSLCPKTQAHAGQATSNSAAQCIEELQQRELAFYQLIGVDPKLPTYGQMGACSALYKTHRYFGFYYSLSDMEIMGIHSIKLDADSWSPEKNDRFEKFKAYKVLRDGPDISIADAGLEGLIVSCIPK